MAKYGRSTFATTLQMYKIMALNCLVSAYQLSALFLYGIKQGDYQASIFGVVIAGFFLFISRSEPLAKLSPERPPTSIFNAADVLSVLLQFAVHFAVLSASVQLALPYTDMDAEEMQPDADFKPNVLNTVVFLVSSLFMTNNFALNYCGHPFMQSLSENKVLFRTAIAAYLILAVCATDSFEPLNDLFELVPLPSGRCSSGSLSPGAWTERGCTALGSCSTMAGQTTRVLCEQGPVRDVRSAGISVADLEAGIEAGLDGETEVLAEVGGVWTPNEFTPLESDFRAALAGLMLADTAMCWVISRATKALLG
jgi:hypothetical protein